MKTNYYQLTESDNGGENIGVVGASTDLELAEKIDLAISEHFDSEMYIDDRRGVTIENIKYGRDYLMNAVDEDGNDHEIHIQ